jgi:8-amino-7-oxononanoate synthase
MYRFYQEHLADLHLNAKYRQLPEPWHNASYNFSSNDYLGLSNNPVLIAAAILAAQTYGVGATGSRLLSGNCKLFSQLEEQIAWAKKTPSALFFNSGFQANVASLATLLNPKILQQQALVFFDRLNHASLYQAVMLSKAQLIRYEHNDLTQLEALLVKYSQDSRPKFIVSETVFGMDGDFADLATMADLARKCDAFLYLDEAHSTGVFGQDGYGLSSDANLADVKFLAMGTFSKALGASGGYIACDEVVKNLIINSAPNFIYSTAAPPMVVATNLAAWQLVPQMEQQRKHLAFLAGYLRRQLMQLGFNIATSSSHIVPIILGAEQETIAAAKLLLGQGIKVSCVRPPTVPPGTSRLRLALTAKHNMCDVEKLLHGVSKL